MNTLTDLIRKYPNVFDRIKNLSNDELIKLYLQNFHTQYEKEHIKRMNKKINYFIQYKSQGNTKSLNQNIKSRIRYNPLLDLNEDSLEDICINGNIQLKQPDFYDYENVNANIYKSNIVNNPTWLDLIYELHKIIINMEFCRYIRVYKSIYIEGYTIIEKNNDLTVIELILGANF